MSYFSHLRVSWGGDGGGDGGGGRGGDHGTLPAIVGYMQSGGGGGGRKKTPKLIIGELASKNCKGENLMNPM